MNGLHILGTGRALPANIVTNDDLALRVETNDAWIVSTNSTGSIRNDGSATRTSNTGTEGDMHEQ